MMPWNFLLLVLIAGYYILTRSFLVKFVQQRLETQRLVFETVFWGISAAVVTYLIRLIVEFTIPCLFNWLRDFLPFKQPHLPTSFFTLVFAICFSELGNKLFLDEKTQIQRAIEKVGNELELTLNNAFKTRKLLQITLDNEKVYVAFVKELPIPSISNYLSIYPALSGYRDEEKELVFTTDYLPFYQDKKMEEMDIEIIIDIKNILTVSKFDLDLYGEFNNAKGEAKKEK